MPTLADMEAATPRCDHVVGVLSRPSMCGRPLRWADRAMRLAMPRNEDYMDGRWCCSKHGPMMSGTDAALRAGFLSCVTVEPQDEAA